MFTSATGYIFSFGLSRRRHEPPFKPGGSVGALVGRPGFRAGFARIRAWGRGRGSVGAACSSRKKPLDLQSSYHLIYSIRGSSPGEVNFFTLTNKNKKEGPQGEGRRIEDGGTSKANKRTSRRRTTRPQTNHRRRHGDNKLLFGSHCEAKLAERSH